MGAGNGSYVVKREKRQLASSQLFLLYCAYLHQLRTRYQNMPWVALNCQCTGTSYVSSTLSCCRYASPLSTAHWTSATRVMCRAHIVNWKGRTEPTGIMQSTFKSEKCHTCKKAPLCQTGAHTEPSSVHPDEPIQWLHVHWLAVMRNAAFLKRLPQPVMSSERLGAPNHMVTHL